jgi:retron-type reverse transcriptase
VVDLDLEKFFDRVNHDGLMARVAARLSDKRVLRLIRAFLKAGVMEDGLVSPVDEGTPQGGPLSPLLSNLVLDDLDKELTRRVARIVSRTKRFEMPLAVGVTELGNPGAALRAATIAERASRR